MNAYTPNFKLKRIVVAVATACVGSSAPGAFGQQIVTDGRTQTTLNVNGAVTDVRTSTIVGNNAFNSFSKFDVHAGNTVNLHVPTSAANLLNLIHDYRSYINGVLNSVKDGKIGGNVFFANPHGVVVGAQGVINTGSLTLLTPTQAFMDDFFTPSGDPSAAATQAMLTGMVPVSDSGMVVVRGRINAQEAIRIAAANVASTGTILSGAEFRGNAPDFSDIVNVNGLQAGAQMVARNGAIEIVASHDIEVTGGRIAAEGGNGVDGGNVTLRAAGNITVSGDGTISARGRGANSSAGDILIYADGTALLAGDAVIDARGGDISGDGGFIEFSARDKVRVEGGRFLAGAHTGAAGSILIDPNDIEIVSLNQFTDGASFSLVANDSITIQAGVIISTRNIANPATGNHLTDASEGNSGNLSLTAEHITLENGVRLLAGADNGFTGGDVSLTALSLNALGADRTADASITATNATITGKNITLSTVAETSRIVQMLETTPGVTLEDAQTFYDNEADDLSDGPGGEYLAVKTDATAKTLLKGVNIDGTGAVRISAMAAARAGFEKTALAEVTIEDGAAASRIKGQTVDITSKADTSLTFNILGTALRLADQSWLPAEDSGEVQLLNDQLFDFSSVPLVSLSESTAKTTISGASVVEATGALNVSSEAVGAAKPTFASPLLFSAAWGESDVTAMTAVNGTTHLIAGGKASVTATTEAEVNVTATLNSTNKPFDAVFVMAQSNAITSAIVGDSTSIDAGAVDVKAKTTADISAGAIARNMGGSGAGFAVAVNLSETTTTATLGGDVEARSGDITVSAVTDISKNNTSAESAVLGNPNTLSAKMANFQAGIQKNVVGGILGAVGKTSSSTSDKLTGFMFPGIKAGKFNVSGAVAYSDATNTATASIAPNAAVQAEGNLSVTSKITDRPNASVGAKATSTGTAIGGSAVIGSFTNNSNAFIGHDATVDAKGALLVDAQTHVPYPWEINWNSPAAILDHLQEGILDLVLTNYAINSASGKEGVGLAAAVNVFSLENNASAYIDHGAKINTVFDKDAMVLPGQSVTVHARNDVNTVNAVGILSRKFLGTSGGKAGIGGSANILDITGNASATIRGDAEVNSENGVSVKAENLSDLVSVTEAGGSSDKIGIEGAVSLNIVSNTTLAAIDDDATIDAGGNVNIEALADIQTISVAGGVVATKGPVGIGMSVSLNTIDSNASAFIGDVEGETAAATGDVATDGNLVLKSTSNTEIGAYSVAGALATNSSAQTDTSGASETQEGSSSSGSSGAGKGKFGIAISGDASVNDITSNTLAYIADGATVSEAGDATLDATNSLAINALAGAVTISTQGGGNGLSGSYAQNTLAGTTAAYIKDATLTLGGDLDIDANVTGDIATLSASLAAAKGKLGVAGSVSINQITNLTQAYLSSADIVDVNALTLSALDDSSIRSIAGAVAFGGKAGIGLSFAWNSLDNDTTAHIEDSDVDADGSITLEATTDNTIDTISAAIGASQGNMAAAGAVSYNAITNTTSAYISGRKTADGVDAPGTVAIAADDSSRIFALAGSLAVATGNAGVGLAFAWSEVANTVSASIGNGADVESTAGGVEVEADSSTSIEAIAAGGGAANKVGIAGSVSFVQAKNTVAAGILGASRVIADGNALVTASDDVAIFSLAGNVALGGKAAIGISNSTLITDNDVTAAIDGAAQVGAEGNQAAAEIYTGGKDGSGNRTTDQVRGLAVAATSHEDIETIAAGGAGAGKAGVAGSATVTLLDETTTATIGAGARINQNNAGASADQSVVLRASDETTQMGVAGAVAFGGSAGVGAGADVGIFTKDTEARIDSSSTAQTIVNARNTVLVDARNAEDILSVAASLAAGGSAGVAGSASAYDLHLATVAEIGASAQVNSNGNVVVSADDATEIDMIAGNAALGGTAGVGASAGVALIDKTTRATIGANAQVNALGNANAVSVADGSFGVSFVNNSGAEGEVSSADASANGSDSQAISKQRVANKGTASVKGVAVTATNKDDIESISATGSIGGTAAVTLAGNVSVVTTNTTAEIAAGAQVNQSNTGAAADQTVLVAAGNDHYHMGVAGSASGGGTVGIGVGADVLVASHTTRALIGDSADVRARRDVGVIALAQEEVLSISAGLGVSGTVGVAGSAAVISIDNTTQAATGTGSAVDADGNVRIAAADTTETDLIVGTLAIGLGGAGVGGSVGVTSISKDTQAAVGSGATVNARGNDTGTMTAYTGETQAQTEAIKGLSVQATSSEDVFAVSAAGAGGFYAGVSGAVTVQAIDSDTTASIGANADVNKGVTGANTAQDVNVAARNDSRMQVITGSLGVGPLGAGVAGAVDVGTFRNDTSASIGNGAEVFARRDVSVNALALADIDSIVASAAGGIVGVAGAVAVYSVGSGLDDEGKDRLKTTEGGFSDVNSYADDQASDGSIKALLDGSSDTRIKDIGTRSQTRRSAVAISSQLSSSTPSGTSAYIGDATVDAGRNVDIDARQQVDVGVLTGAAAVGIVGLGAGVGVVSVNGANQAYIAGGASVSAGDDVLITAGTSGNSQVDAYVGSGGVVAVDASVAIISDRMTTSATIGEAAEVTKADDIDIDAIDRRTTRAHAFGASVGAAAAGASIAKATIGGTVQAGVGANAQIGQGSTSVNDLLINADSETTAESEAEAAKAGLGLAAGGAAATSTANARVSSFIADGADVKLQDTANVAAIGKIKADASAIGVNASLGAAVGASVALANASPIIAATIGKNVVLEADSLTLSAAQAVLGTGTQASATGASGGLLVGANATVAKATANGQVTSKVDDGSTLTVGGITSVSADNDSLQVADAKGFSAGILALGANVAQAESSTRTEATLGNDVKVTGGTLLVSASGEDENRASALAGSGGAISGLASYAGTTSNSETYARTGSGSATRAIDVGTLSIDAGHTARFNSDVNSTNASLVGASGALAENSVNSRSEARVGANGYVLADNIAVEASNVLRKDWLSGWNVRSGSGGLFDLPAARSITNTVTNAIAAVDSGATIEQTAPGSFRFDAWNDVLARDKVSMDSGGAIAVAKGISKVLADTNNATVSIGGGAELVGQGDINMGARSIGDVYAQVAVDTYGVAGAPSGESVARFQAVNKVDIGDALIRSEGRDVNIGAGRNSSGALNDIDATARTDLFNNTAIPINSDPTADAIIGTQSIIDVAAGADIEAVRHVTLFADKGNADASGVGVGKDIYREALAAVASAISNAFGGEDVSFETRSGRSVETQTSDVEVDGSVKVGIHRKLELEIDINGNVVKASDGISIIDTQFKDVAKDILDRIAALEELIKEYTVSAAGSDAAIAVEAYKSEIRFLERKLKELGFQSAGSGFSSVPKVSERQAAVDSVAGMTATRTGYQADVTTRTSQNTTLTNQIAGHNATIASNNTTIAANNTTIASNNATIAGLDPEDDATQIQNLRNQNASLQSQNATLGNQNTTLTTITIPDLQAQVAANQAQIDSLNGLITGLSGQITQVQAKIDSGTLNTTVASGPIAQFLTVSDATAQLGNIYVRGDRLHGGGTLSAPGDAEIKITNNSDSFLILQDLNIPPEDGGKLYFNNIDVKSNAQINGINGPSGGAAFSVQTAESNVAPDGTLLTPFKPQILVTSKYDPLDPFYIAASGGTASLAPDIVLKGDVANLRGLVKVDAAAGSIRVEETASINAGQVEISTRNGDFVQSYTNTFSHVAGTPLTYVPGNPGQLDRVDLTPEAPGKGIVANGSVLIAARYLNINGTVQSGISEWGVSVPNGATLTIPGGSTTATFAQVQAHYNGLSPAQKAVLGSEYYEVTGATVSGLSGNTQGAWQKVTVRYNARENRLELAGVQVQGGYIELFGQIFNTNSNGGGKLRVLDGYGQIKVDNQSGLDLVINVLDTGRGVQGEINITNITGLNADGTPIVTTTNYTRAPGGSRSATFNPTPGLRYVLTKGTDTVVESFYRYSQSGWFDINATMTAKTQDQYKINSITKSNDPLSKGEYLINWTSDNGTGISGDKYHDNSRTYTLSDVITPGNSWKDCNWWTLCANATYYSEYYRSTGTKAVNTYSVKADYPIGIEYIGFDQGTVNVTSNGSVLINGSVNNRVGNTNIASTLGSVTQLNDGAIVSGTNVALAANTGIGSASQLVQVNVGSGKLDATSNSGSVNVKQVVGDLRVGTIGGAGVSKVVLDVERNLTGATAGAYVQGKRVELLSRNGAIGDSGTPLTVRTGYSTDMNLWPDLGLQATARDNIDIRNVADGSNAAYNGNLLLISAESLSGDVRIETSGTVLDNNPFASTDERTLTELNAFWDSLRLRGALAEQKAAEQVAAFENGVTQDYRSYWTTRSRQADSSTYDPAFEFKLTTAEKARFAQSGMTAQQIADFETEKTTQYHTLNERLYGTSATSVKGAVDATFNAAFVYHADPATEVAAITAGSEWSDSQLLLSVGAGLLKEITDTVSVIKQPNARGRNVTLLAGTGIGSFDNPLDIDLTAGLNSLTPQQRAALAAAERGDATLNGSIIRIAQPRPVNVAVGSTGALTATTTSGRAFIGSEFDLPLNLVSAPGEIRLKAAGALIDAAAVAGAANLIGGNTILEASSGGIGASADADGNVSGPLRLQLGSGATIIARAADDIWLAETSDLNVDTLYSRKDIRLETPGSIKDAYNDSEVNIRARSLDLHAGAGIGALGNALDIQLDNRLETAPATDPSGWLTSDSGTGTYLNSSGNPLIVRSLDAGTEVRMTAGLQGITVDGSVTAPAGIDLASQGLLTLTANAIIDSADSDVSITGGSILLEGGSLVEAGTGDITLTATTGDITGDGNGAAFLYGGNVRMVAQAGAVGTATAGVVVDTDSNVGLQAVTGIDYREVTGDLGTDGISSTNGPVSIAVSAGSLQADHVSTGTGDITIGVSGDLLAGDIVAGTGSIGLTVGGSAVLDHVSASDTVDILVNGMSLMIDTIDPATTRMQVTGSGGSIEVTSLLTSGSVIAYADHVLLGSVQDTDPSNPLNFTVAGANGGIASEVDIFTFGAPAVVFDRLWADNARVRTSALDLSFYDNVILSRAVFQNGLYTVDVDNVNKTLHGNDVQLWSGSSPFYLLMGSNPKVFTNALVVDYKDSFIVNEYSSENSFVRLTPKLLSQAERGLEDERKDEAAADAPQEGVVTVPEQPLGDDDNLIGNPLDLRASR